jgi:hypothetical protein
MVGSRGALVDPTAHAADLLAASHARLLANHQFQFDFKHPTTPPKPPEWILQVFRLMAKLAPYLQWLFWVVLAAGVVSILVLLLRELVLYRRPAKAAASVSLRDDEWRPSAARAKALLAEADRLAGEERYDEAAHVLLYRSIDDIEERRPRLIALAHTSRDIAALGSLPKAAADALNTIVYHVERSLFGGHRLDAAAFRDCRRAYEAFAFPHQWSSSA